MSMHATGLRTKLAEFFDNNPDEELTFHDIQAKWGVSIACCSRAVRMLCEEGMLEDRPRIVRRWQPPHATPLYAANGSMNGSKGPQP